MKSHHRSITLLVLIGLVVTQSGAAQGIRLKPMPGTRGVATGTGATETGMTIGPSTSDATPPGNITSRPGIVTVSLTWPAVTGASSYSVMRAPGADGRFVPVTATPITDAEFTDNGLTPATSYYYKVSATRPDGHFGISAPVHVRTIAGRNPTGLKGSAKGNDVTLVWDAVPGVASYSVLVPGRPHVTVAGTTYTANALPDGANAFAVWSLHRSGNQDYAADEQNPARVTVTAGVLRGHYRVTLTGFTVHHETVDNAAQWDGKRDEVFVSTDVKFLDAEGNQVIQGFSPGAPSYVFGDMNGVTEQNRRQAGTGGDQGGLRTGDRYPNDPYIGLPLQGPQWIPLKLWEGDLAQGQNAVVVTPTIWEYDGSQNSAVFNGWVQWAQGTTKKLQESKEFGELIGPKGATALALTGLTLDIALSFSNHVLGQDGDRPIGVNRPNRETVNFQPQSLALNYDNIERFLSAGHEMAGLPRGVYPVTYIDTGEWGGGNYTVYLKIEKL